MTISIKDYDKTVTVSFEEGSYDLNELIESFVDLILAAGYDQQWVKRSIIELANRYEFEEEMNEEMNDDEEDCDVCNNESSCCKFRDSELEKESKYINYDLESTIKDAFYEIVKMELCKKENSSECCSNNSTIKDCKKDNVNVTEDNITFKITY